MDAEGSVYLHPIDCEKQKEACVHKGAANGDIMRL